MKGEVFLGGVITFGYQTTVCCARNAILAIAYELLLLCVRCFFDYVLFFKRIHSLFGGSSDFSIR
jgi:hypothetical protein